MALSYEEKILRIIRRGAFIVCIIALILFFVSSSADKGLLEPKSYEFQIYLEPSEGSELWNFQVTHDFIENKGNIHFFIRYTQYTEYITFFLPKEIEIENINWTNKNYRHDNNFLAYEEGTDYEIENELNEKTDELKYQIKNRAMQDKEQMTTIDIQYFGELSPNAEYRIDTTGGKVKPPTGIENGAFFKFNFGERYVCTQPICYESFREEELKFHFRDNRLTVATARTEPSGWEDITYHIFNLNYNKENNENLVRLRDVSTFFLALSLIPTIEFIIYWNLKRKNRRKKK